jgi:Tfp pilus assembly protein PilN
MIGRIWTAMLAAGSLRFWSQLGAGMALTLVFVGYGLVIWRGPWAATRQQQQIDLLGQGQIAAALMVLVALVCITGMKLSASAGKDGVKADVERDDEPPTVTTTTTTETTQR